MSVKRTEFQQNLIEYLDTLRPEKRKWKNKVTCTGCNCRSCMFSPWCDTDDSPAMILFNAARFEKMLKAWKAERDKKWTNIVQIVDASDRH